MIDFINLKNSYISAINAGLMMNAAYKEAKRGNDILYHFSKTASTTANTVSRKSNQ